MAIASGKLRHRLRLQEQQTTQDPATGELLVLWVTIAEFWGEKVPLSAKDFISASSQQSEIRGRFTIRFRSNINASMRILHKGLAHQIIGVLPDAESGIEYLSIPYGEGVRVT